MYNITKGNTIPMKAILEHEEERFPVAVSTNISVRAYNEYRYIDAENVTVDQEEDGVLYFEIPPTLNTGIFGVEVKGNVNGVSWRTATDGVVKITGATQRNEGSEAVPDGDTYDIVMKVQMYKQQSPDRAIEEHNRDETSHPYILGELERIEGEIPTLPEHIVTDANYVHTDNNYTTEEKTKLAGLENYDDTNVLNLIEQTNQNFANYYTKAQTYSQSEVNQLLETHRQGQYVVVNEIPVASADTMFKIYLVPSSDPQTSNIKDEYITIDNGSEATTRYTWEKIGSTAVDLSGYSTTEEMNAAIASALASYYTKTEADALLGGKQDTISDLSTIRSGAQAGATAYQKPAGGIPKTDLAQDVKDSLDKADTALQEDTLYVKVNNNGHEYVDLGLPSGTLWAKCNVGADAETGYGNYYMYGKGARQYNSSDSPYTGTEDPLDLSVDTARQVLGGSWKMPTQAQMQELVNNTTYEFTTINGVNGAKFTAQNGNYVFLPAAGEWDNGSMYDVGDNGDYWGSSPNGSNNACYLFIGDGYKGVGNDIREYGYSVRGVILPEKTQLKQDLDNKQDTLVSGTNIKTINNQSILGSGNITIQGGGGSQVQSDWNQSDNTAVDYIKNKPTIPEIPSNLAYTSNDNGEGIVPSDGIRPITLTSAAAMTISPDVVTVIDGAVGTTAITLQVPQDNLAHVWDILLTTDSSVAITFAMSNSATILTPSGFSIGASKAVEISVIGVGTKYYLRYGEFA